MFPRTRAAKFVIDIAARIDYTDARSISPAVRRACAACPPSLTGRTCMQNRRAMLIIATAGAIVFLSMGIRQSLGIFMPAITADLGIGREA